MASDDVPEIPFPNCCTSYQVYTRPTKLSLLLALPHARGKRTIFSFFLHALLELFLAKGSPCNCASLNQKPQSARCRLCHHNPQPHRLPPISAPQRTYHSASLSLPLPPIPPSLPLPLHFSPLSSQLEKWCPQCLLLCWSWLRWLCNWRKPRTSRC